MLEAIHPTQESEIRYDESRWPFVVVTMPAGEMSDAQLDDHLRDIDGYAARGGPYGFVVDARAPTPPTAAQRRKIAESMDRNAHRDGDRFIGVAIVITSMPARAVFKALVWLRQGSHPLQAVATVAEGLKWLRGLEQRAAAQGPYENAP